MHHRTTNNHLLLGSAGLAASRLLAGAAIKGSISDEFERSIVVALARQPLSAVDIAASGKLKFVLASTVLDYDPRLGECRPLGWPSGSTWAEAEGFYCLALGHVVITEWSKSGEKWQKSKRVLGCLVHEFAHGLDEALGWFSLSPEFIAAYLKDVAKFIRNPEICHRLAYYLQGFSLDSNLRGSDLEGVDSASQEQHWAHGLQEAFAEVYACMHGQGTNPEDRALILSRFPNVAFCIRERLKRI